MFNVSDLEKLYLKPALQIRSQMSKTFPNLPQFRCSRFRSSVSHSLVKLRFFYIKLFQLNDISNFDGKESQFEAQIGAMQNFLFSLFIKIFSITPFMCRYRIEVEKIILLDIIVADISISNASNEIRKKVKHSKLSDNVS